MNPTPSDNGTPSTEATTLTIMTPGSPSLNSMPSDDDAYFRSQSPFGLGSISTMSISNKNPLVRISGTLPVNVADSPFLELRTVRREEIWALDSKECMELKEIFRKQLQRGIDRLVEAKLLVPTILGPVTVSPDLFVTIPGLPDEDTWEKMKPEERNNAAKAIHPSIEPLLIPHSEVHAFVNHFHAKSFEHLRPYGEFIDEMEELLYETQETQKVNIQLILEQTTVLEARLEVIYTKFQDLTDKQEEIANGAAARSPWTYGHLTSSYREPLNDLFGPEKTSEWLSTECSWRGEVGGFCIWWTQIDCFLGQLSLHYNYKCTMTPDGLNQIETLLADASRSLVESLANFDMPSDAVADIKAWEDRVEEWEDDDEDEESDTGVDYDDEEDGAAEFWQNWQDGKTILTC